MADGTNYIGDLPHYVLDHLFDNLTDKSYRNVDDRNSVNMLQIITRKTNDNRGIFDRICYVGDWEIYIIPEYADDAIRTAM